MIATSKQALSTFDDSPVVVHARVVTGSGGGPDKTILNSPRFLLPLGYRAVCAYMYPPADPGFSKLQQRAEDSCARLLGIPDRGAWDWRVVTSMLELCRRERVTIWHGHDYKSNVLGVLLRRFWPMRLVTTVHGWGVTGGRRRWYYTIDRMSMRYYERVICVSDDLLQQCIRSGVPESRCRLVENAIDADHFIRREDRPAAKLRLGIPAARTVIGAVGRLSAEKGFDRLIAAFQRLVASGHDLHLCIIGDGPDKGSLTRQVARLGLDDRVVIPGYQSNTIEWYHAMDVYALSSLREGMPNVVLEAMALEVPVVATKIAGVPRLVTDGENGLLVEPDSVDELAAALRTLIADVALRERLAQAGRKTIEDRYTFTARMQRIRSIYDEVLGR